MKSRSAPANDARFSHQISGRATWFLLFGLVAAILTGCATGNHAESGSIVRAGPTLTDRARAELGIVGVVTPSIAAACAIDKPKGQTDYPADRAGSVAHDILSFQPIGHPQLDAVIAVADAAVAPFAATAAAISARKHKLPADSLSD